MPPTAHARLGASKSSRWLNCPGSVALEDGLPDTPSEYALEGTAAHDLAEICLCLNEDTDAREFLGCTLYVQKDDMDEPATFEVTEEMAAAVQVYLDYVRENTADDAIRYVEHQFDLAPLDPPEPIFGTSDCTIWSPVTKHLHVIDYKHGRGVAVDAVGNTQGQQYALGAVVDLKAKPQTITVTIVQPRADHPDGPIRSWTFGWDELVAFKEHMFKKAREAQEEDAELAVGPWCKFCKASAICPAQRAQAESVALTEFSAEVEPADAPPPPESLSEEDLANVLARADDVRDWLKAVEKYATTILEQGGEVPGYKLVEGSKHRKWTDEEKADSFLARRGLKIGQRTTRKLISPAQAEKLLPDDVELIEKYWEKPEGPPKLAPADDSRPALSNGAPEFDLLASGE